MEYQREAGRRIRVGIVGAGSHSYRNIFPTLTYLPVELVAVADIDAEKLDRERAVYREQAEGSGKPAEVIEKMVEGRVRKYYEEVVLLEQLYVIDGKTKISQVVADAGKEIGKPVKITGFVRFQLGEGIEKQATDFAAEVAAAAGSNAA